MGSSEGSGFERRRRGRRMVKVAACTLETDARGRWTKLWSIRRTRHVENDVRPFARADNECPAPSRERSRERIEKCFGLQRSFIDRIRRWAIVSQLTALSWSGRRPGRTGLSGGEEGPPGRREHGLDRVPPSGSAADASPNVNRSAHVAPSRNAPAGASEAKEERRNR